ncbi:MAG: ribosomal protein L7/L12 [Actinomycetia bacterium]|nr:ribosomal protein L7/L12 [Actinomycetes bacterium]
MLSETEAQLLQLRVTELEQRLQFIYRQLNIDYAHPTTTQDPALSPQVQEALKSGNKIAAIKFYRELTNCSLADAKDAIDRAEQFIR